jgi:PASTA domain
MAEPDVKTPGGGGTVKLFGQSVSKKTLMIGGLVGAGVLGYAWYRKSKNSSAAAASTDTSATDSTAGIDPATGYPYGSAEDTEALSAQQDSGLDTNTGSDIDPETGYPYDSTQDLAALGYTSTGGTGSTGSTGSTATTPSEWEQEAITNLQDGGVSAATLSAAEEGLPRYLANLPQLSSADVTAVQLAVGLTGPAPGGPYSIIQPAPAPPGTGSGSGSGTVTVPRLAGDRVEDATSALTSLGLKGTFGARKPNVAYWVTASSPKAGAKVAAGSTVKLTISSAQPKA